MINIASMLWIIWCGLVAFLGVAYVVVLFLTADDCAKARRIVVPLILVLTAGFWVRSLGNAERTANDFMRAWQAASFGFPDGRANTPEMYEFIDFNRARNLSGNFPIEFKLVEKQPMASKGAEVITPHSGGVSVRTKVFLGGVRIHSGEHDIDYTANVRIWVAEDNDKVVQFMFEDIQFQ